MRNELFIYGDIGSGWWSDGIEEVDVLNALNSITDPGDGIDIRINTYGGDVSIGLTIMNLLRDYTRKQQVLNKNFTSKTIIDGYAYSAGTIVMLASDNRVMNPGTKLMIHNALSFCVGDHREMRKMADNLEATSDSIADLFHQVTKQDMKDIRALMDAETYMSPDEGKKFGLVTEVVSLEPTKKDENFSPGSRLLAYSRPYENNKKFLDSVQTMGKGAYRQSFTMMQKNRKNERGIPLDVLQEELELSMIP